MRTTWPKMVGFVRWAIGYRCLSSLGLPRLGRRTDPPKLGDWVLGVSVLLANDVKDSNLNGFLFFVRPFITF